MSHAKSYPRIAEKLFCTPWAILPAVHETICAQFIARMEGTDTTAMKAEQLRQDIEAAATDGVGKKWRDQDTGEEGYWHPQVETGNGVALLQVHGILGKHLSTLEMWCGAYDVALFEKQMENIRDDESIKSVIIDFRSPGGIVMGIQSAAESILEVRAAGKKVYGYTSECCASAAYWLASACDEFHAEFTAVVGSISTIMRATDTSGEWAQKGWKAEIFSTGKFKAMGAPGKPWTDDERANVTEKMNLIDADFKGFIKATRGLSDELMQGQWWHAGHAPEGLVDSTDFRSLEDLISTVMAG